MSQLRDDLQLFRVVLREMILMAKGIQYQLWTPIANAYEAYRRRLIKSPTAIYEHTWRLIDPY
ncbi:hypothetical protein FNW02_19610 [Komarekiella sp. 'clone 1']|uniref:Uncharacterized protein n=1 Tax=Komarekiella delphini-convector SJRDD-AB1 TaxID=2593771 RepID=A0AA40VT07_9NOST|nr:hypothetical protein [Komarekiella delphini-convector SJRDD-AB1]